MWFRTRPKMPYHADPDYRDSVVDSIKQTLGDVPVDVTLLETYGVLEVDIDPAQEELLTSLPLLGLVVRSVDRDFVTGPRVVV